VFNRKFFFAKKSFGDHHRRDLDIERNWDVLFHHTSVLHVYNMIEGRGDTMEFQWVGAGHHVRRHSKRQLSTILLLL
jgi:hypothetical protein